MASILGMARAGLGPDAVEAAAGLIGESATVTQRGLESAVSSVLAGVLGQASSPSGAEHLLSTITGGGYGAHTVSGLGRWLGEGGPTETFLILRSGAQLLSALFGGQVDGVADAVASTAGVERTAATTLLRLAAPIVMGVLGTRVASGGLDAGGLSRLLAGERTSILGAAPAGVTRLLGLREPMTVPADEEAALVSTRREPIEPAWEHPISSWWPAALLGLATLAALAFLYFVTPGPEKPTARLDTAPPAERSAALRVATPEPTSAPAASVGEPTPPTSTSAAPPSSAPTWAPSDALDRISEFLTSAEPTPRSFILNDLNFENGSVQLMPSAQPTVAALADLLKAHPLARVRLEGHTDSSGDAAINKRVSAQRAAAVKSALVAAGAAQDRIEIAGYGSEQPVADDRTDAGRASNRRIELVIVQR